MILAFAIDGGLHEIGHGDTGDLDRVLERKENALVCALLRFQTEEVLTIESDGAVSDGIYWVSCQDGREGALAGAVGTHDGVGLTGFNFEVYAAEDFLAIDGGVKIFYA